MPIRHLIAALCAAAFAVAASAEDNPQALFDKHCASCHASPPQGSNIPKLEALRALDTNVIVDALRDGPMRIQGQYLTPAQHIAVAQFITGKPYLPPPAAFTRGLCTAAPPSPTFAAGTTWNGWGADQRNTRYVAETGGLAAADVPKLKLKWAFGIPGATQSRSQPAVLGDRVFMASATGAVYALDAKTGCTYWIYQARAGVRTAISVGPFEGGYAVYFADAQTNAYAVDAQTGRLLWSQKVDDHPAARATGAPTLYNGRLYVVLSGVAEENAASMPDYECCTFRGSLTALNAETGEGIWKTYTVPKPKRRGTSASGRPLWGPAGSPIWAAPTIDAKRGLIYVATGNSYADPVQKTSDAVVAFSMKTGKIVWVRQITPGDVWILGCGKDVAIPGLPPRAPATDGRKNANCPKKAGPDHDFSASPVLATTPEGRDVLVVAQKASVATALDPDHGGKVLWQYRFGEGSSVGGVWGLATDGVRAYFADASQFTESPGGVSAVGLLTGDPVWAVDPEPALCKTGPGCSTAQSAALTAIPGVVFSGSADGGVRAYEAATGKVVWRFDVNRAFDTVNGVEAKGGSIDGPGPIVAGGRLYVTAGNGGFVGTPGNVLLAFEVGQ
jgi:polyvinyl alcohol dehydrogenase (cytochrome)